MIRIIAWHASRMFLVVCKPSCQCCYKPYKPIHSNPPQRRGDGVQSLDSLGRHRGVVAYSRRAFAVTRSTTPAIFGRGEVDAERSPRASPESPLISR